MTLFQSGIWTPQKDFRERFSQRDLEISRNEYERAKDRYLELKREREEKEEADRKKKKKAEEEAKRAAELEKQRLEEAKKKAADTVAARHDTIAALLDTIASKQDTIAAFSPEPVEISDSTFGNKEDIKPIHRPVLSDDEQLQESVGEIKVPSITSLIDDYTKPVAYDETTGKFSIIDQSDEEIEETRNEIANRPAPYGLTSNEAAYMRATDESARVDDVRKLFNPYSNYTKQGLTNRFKDYQETGGDYWIYDGMSKIAIDKNNSEFESYAGDIVLVDEKRQYADNILKYVNNLDEFMSRSQDYSIIDDFVKGGTITKEQGDKIKRDHLIRMNQIISENQKAQKNVSDGSTYSFTLGTLKNVAKDLKDFVVRALSQPMSPSGLTYNAASSFGGKDPMSMQSYELLTAAKDITSNDIGTETRKLLALILNEPLKPGEGPSEEFVRRYKEISLNIHKYYEDFSKDADEATEYAQKMALKNKEEALEWEAWHSPSKEFLAKVEANQDNYLTNIGTYTHGMFGFLGSSLAFNGTQLLSSGLDIVGNVLMMAPHPAAKTAGMAATAAGGALGISSGEGENATEIANSYSSSLRAALEQEGKLEDFIKEGKRQLSKKGIKVRTEQDVFDHFMLKDYIPTDPTVRNIALRKLFGANNAFQNDMMAVSADVALNTGLNIFGAGSAAGEAMKLIPKGSKFAVLSQFAREESKTGSAIGSIFEALGPMGSVLYKATRPIRDAIGKSIDPLIEQLAGHMDNAIKLAKIAPKSLYNGTTRFKHSIDFLGKTAVRGWSEAVEEGKQYEYGKKFEEGGFAGASNTMLDTLMDDLSTGTYTALSFIGDQFFGIQADKELMANMRGGFLGGLFNHGSLISAYHAYSNASKEIKAGDLIFSMIESEKLAQRMDIANGEMMARYASRPDLVAMSKAFDRFEALQSRITDEDAGRYGISKEIIDRQRDMYKKILGIYHSPQIESRAKRIGIKKGSDKYNTLVSLINTAENIYRLGATLYNEMVQQARKVLEQDFGLPLEAIQEAKRQYDNATDIINEDGTVTTAESQRERIEKAMQEVAENFAENLGRINQNLILSQIMTLTEMMSEMTLQFPKLNSAQKKVMAHYEREYNKLMNILRSYGIDDMQVPDMFDSVPQDVLLAYKMVYRPLYQAEALLEDAARVYVNLTGMSMPNMDAMSDSYVQALMDSIAETVVGNSDDVKSKTAESLKKRLDAEAKSILDRYANSVKDDQLLMSEIADMFNNGETERQQKLLNSVMDDEEVAVDENNDAEPVGAMNLPIPVSSKIDKAAWDYTVGLLIGDGKTTFRVTGITGNRATGETVVEGVDDKGNVHNITNEDFFNYQKLLPAPFHYEMALYPHKRDNVMRNIYDYINRQIADGFVVNIQALADAISEATETILKGDVDDDTSQKSVAVRVAQLLNREPVFVSAIGVLVKDGEHFVYYPASSEVIGGIYNDFPSAVRKRAAKVNELSALLKKNDTEAIEKILLENNLPKEFAELLSDPIVMEHVAKLIVEPKLVEYSKNKQLANNMAYESEKLLNSDRSVVLPGFSLISNGVAHDIAYIEIRRDGTIRIGITTVSKDKYSDKEIWSEKTETLVLSRKEYFTRIASRIFEALPDDLQRMVANIYLHAYSAENDLFLRFIPTKTRSVAVDSQINTSMYGRALSLYIADVTDQVATYPKYITTAPRKRPQPENNGSAEDIIANISKNLDILELAIQGVYNGTYTFNGMIREDVYSYLVDQLQKGLTLAMRDIKSLPQNEQTRDILQRIDRLWRTDIRRVLLVYNRTYQRADYITTGDAIQHHMMVVQDNHPIMALSTSGIPVTQSPDFVTNSTIQLVYGWLDPRTGEITKLNGYSAQDGVSVYAKITYRGVTYPPIPILPSHYKNGVRANTDEGWKFIQDVISLLNNEQGLPVTAEFGRMRPSYRFNGPIQPVTSVPVLGITNEYLLTLTPDSNDVGIVNLRGELGRISKDGIKLWQFGVEQSGSVFLLAKPQFDETDDIRVPIKLIPAKLTPNDLTVAIVIFRDNAMSIQTGSGSIMTRPYNKDGVEYPFTNAQVLQMLLPFDLNPSNESKLWVDASGAVHYKQNLSANDVIIRPDKEHMSSSTIRTIFGNGYEVPTSRNILNIKLDRIPGIKQFLKDNGAIKICDNIVIDPEDVLSDNGSMYGIGWSIKHGRLLTNCSGAYNASLYVQNPTIDDGTTKNPRTEFTEPKPENVADQYTFNDDSFGEVDFGAIEFHAVEDVPVEPLDEDEVTEDIKRMLGDTAVQFVDGIIGVLKGGLKILGYVIDNAMVISRLASDGTHFHESFHKILELLLSEDERNRIYNAFAKTHPEVDSTNARILSESLAEDFRAYANNRKSKLSLKKIWNKILQWCKIFSSSNYRILYKMYRDAYNGKYANYKVSKENIERFNTVFDTGDNQGILYHTRFDQQTGEKFDLPHMSSDIEYKQAVDQIVDNVLNTHASDLFGTKTNKLKLDLESIKRIMVKRDGKDVSLYDSLVSHPNKQIAAVFKDLFDNWDHVTPDATISLKRFGLHLRLKRDKATLEKLSTKKSEAEQDKKDDALGGQIGGIDIGQYTLEDYELSKIDKADAKTKYFFATVPDVRFAEEDDDAPMYVWETNERGEPIDVNGRVIKRDPETGREYIPLENGGTSEKIERNAVRNIVTNPNIFGMVHFAPMMQTMKIAVNRCYDCEDLPELLKRFKELSKEFPQFSIIANRFAKVMLNMRAKTKDGCYLAEDGSRYERFSNGLYKKKIGKDKYEAKWYNESEIKFAINYNSESIAVQIFNDLSGVRMDYTHMMSTRTSKDTIVFLISNTDSGYTARKYTQAWSTAFLSDESKCTAEEVTRNGEQIIRYVPKDPKMFTRIADQINSLIKAYTDYTSTEYKTRSIVVNDQKVNIYTDYQKVKSYYVLLLNQIGVLVQVDEFDTLLFNLFGTSDGRALAKYFAQKGDDYGQTKGVNIFNLVLQLQLAVDKSGHLYYAFESGAFYSKTGAILQLADGVYLHKQSVNSLMVNAPGRNKYYVIANKNVIDIMMHDLNNPNSDYLNDLLGDSWAAGSYCLNLLKSEQITLSSTTNAGYRSDNKSDYGNDFMSITDPEDFVTKLTYLLEGYITGPTMSNKKTYQPIKISNRETGEQLQLPGIYFTANKRNVLTNGASAEKYTASNIPVLLPNTYEQLIVTEGEFKGEHFVFSDDVYTALLNYAYSEYYSIQDAIERDKLLGPLDRVYNYDTATYGAKIPGSMRFTRLYEIEVPYRDPGDGKIKLRPIDFNNQEAGVEDNLKNAKEYFFGENVSNEERKAILSHMLMKNLDKMLDYMVRLGVIRRKQVNPNSDIIKNYGKYSIYEPVVISTDHLNSIIQAMNSDQKIGPPEVIRSRALVTLIADIMVKHQISNEEYQRMFVGHPGLFKTFFNQDGVTDDTGDLSKRLGGHVSTGETNCRLPGVPREVSVAELSDYKIASPMKDVLSGWFDESESRFALYAEKQKKEFINRDKILALFARNQLEIIGKHYTKETLEHIFPEVFQYVKDENLHTDLVTSLLAATNVQAIKDAALYLSIATKAIKDQCSANITNEYKRQSALKLQDVKDELNDLGLLSGVNTRVAAYGDAFGKGKVNVADGMTMISPDMVKHLLRSIGKFNGPVAKAWDLLQNSKGVDVLADAVNYKIISDAIFGTQKYTATGMRMSFGRPIGFYMKTALFPMFKLIAKGRTMDVYELMEKDGVHMLAFESSMKYGGEGKQAFPETKEQLKNFKFHTYKIDMKYIRKQLNTDPKEEELQKMGSQALKIVMTVLDIYKHDYKDRRTGEYHSGLEIRDQVHEALRELAKLGAKQVIDRVSDPVDKANYLKDNLNDRDANQNMIEGLTLKNGEREPLAVLSNGGWILSIATSLCNKHIIDVNLPGSAYIQRSVYTMESGRILGDSDVEGIPELKMKNDEGSMDCVISIDYFYKFFPFLEKMSFNEARDWLIKNKIIGPDATAETMCYRIPTQANSSIHALKFVDVIGVVRDTIILPKEFTAITGSDFDIDKLFLTTKFYKVGEDGSVSTEFEEAGEEFQKHANKLLELYLMLLCQSGPMYANQLLRSIDYDTLIPMSIVNKLRANSTKKVGVFDAVSMYKQCMIKSDNRTGGIGVGPYALNNNSQIQSRLFLIQFEDRGMSHALAIQRMYDLMDTEGNSIMAMTGAFITGHVDIAKDTWVPELNINEYTYDIHLLLARTGLGKRSLYFCSQPIMRECSRVYIAAGGHLLDSRDQSAWTKRNNAFLKLERDLFIGYNSENVHYKRLLKLAREQGSIYGEVKSLLDKDGNLIEDAFELRRMYLIIQQILGIDTNDPNLRVNNIIMSDGNKGTIIEDMIYMDRNAIFNNTPRYTVKVTSYDKDRGFFEEEIPLSTKDAQFYVYLANVMLDPMVQDMRNLVQYSKIETKKQGKNLAEQYAYNYKFTNFFIHGQSNMMTTESLDNFVQNSAIATKQSLFMDVMRYILRDELIEASDEIYDTIIPEFIKTCAIPVNALNMTAVFNAILAYIKYQHIAAYALQHNINLRDLFVGNNSMYNELLRLRARINSYPAIYREYIGRDGKLRCAILNALEPSDIPNYVLQEYKGSLPKFITIPINTDDNSLDENDLISSWLQMLTDDKHPDIKEFAERLVVYSFMTSGDANVFGGFFNLVPLEWRTDLSKVGADTYSSYIKEYISRSNNMALDGKLISSLNNESAFTEILLNNWFDDELVPTIQETYTDAFQIVWNNYQEYVVNGEPLLISLVRTAFDGNGKRVYKEPTQKTPRLVIKIHKNDANSYNNPQDFRFYSFIRMATAVDVDGKFISFPVYGRVAPTGGLMYGHRIIQYGENLDLQWEKDTMLYSERRDSTFRDGIAKFIKMYKEQMYRFNNVPFEERRDYIIMNHMNDPITGSWDDGEQISWKPMHLFYDMARMMASYQILYVKENDRVSATGALDNIARPTANMPTVIENLEGFWTREQALNDPKTLYIFTDNTNRTSGSNPIDPNSNYAKKYSTNGSLLFYPTITTAVIRGLDNAFPVSTQRYYDPANGLVRKTGRWTNADIDEFKRVIDEEFEDIKKAWNSGKYTRIMIPDGDGFFNSDITDISETGDRSELYKYLHEKLLQLYSLNTTIQGKEKGTAIDVYSTNRDAWANLSNVAVRDVKAGASITSVVLKHFPIDGIGKFMEDWLHEMQTGKTESHGVTISNNLLSEYRGWLAQHPDGIVAYRINKQNFNQPSYVQSGIIGNPFDWLKYGVDNASNMFVDWLITGNNYNEPMANEAFRQAILEKIIQTDTPEILYYKELGKPSHATAIGYLIEHKEVIGKESVLNVAMQYLRGAGKESFNCVEQAFLMIKFAAMRSYIQNERRNKFGNLKFNQRTPEVMRESKEYGELVKYCESKLEAVAKLSGSAITSESHKNKPPRVQVIDDFFNNAWNQGGIERVKDSTAYDIMKEIMKVSFINNVGAAKLLLASEDRPFTHNKAVGIWKVGFPAALEEVRDYIKEHYDKIKENTAKIITMMGGNEFAYEAVSTAVKSAKDGILFGDVQSFFTPEEVAQIQQAIPEMKTSVSIAGKKVEVKGKFVVSSASRATDPVFYATNIIETLRQNANKPLTDPTRINAIELWTKHDGLSILNILEACKKYRVAPMVQFSITGFGDTPLEKGVMKPDDLLDRIQKLIDQGLIDPRVLTIRIDPIILGVTKVLELRHIITRAADMGVRKFVTSVMQTYDFDEKRTVIPYIDEALSKIKDRAIRYPGAFDANGRYMWEKFYGVDKRNGRINHYASYRNNPKLAEYMDPYLDMFWEMMNSRGISIQSCAIQMGQGARLLKSSACLDPAIIEAVVGIKTDPVVDQSRVYCNCYQVHSDMFGIHDACYSCCSYCYRGWGVSNPIQYYDENGNLKDFGFTLINDYSTASHDTAPTKVRLGLFEYTVQGSTVTDAQGTVLEGPNRLRAIWGAETKHNRASIVNVFGIYYVVTTDGKIFNWSTAKAMQFVEGDLLKKLILNAASLNNYAKIRAESLFNSDELKQLGESRKKFCKS